MIPIRKLRNHFVKLVEFRYTDVPRFVELYKKMNEIIRFVNNNNGLKTYCPNCNSFKQFYNTAPNKALFECSNCREQFYFKLEQWKIGN